MFKFVVTYLGALKEIPLLPHIFDAGLRLFYLLFKKEVSESIDTVENIVSSWEGVTLSMHKYGGRQFNYRDRELGHMHSNGIVDVLLDRKTKYQLVQQGVATDHQVFKNSGWLTIAITTKHDVYKVIDVLQLSKKRIENSFKR